MDAKTNGALVVTAAKPRIRIQPPASGHKRQWVRCRTCRQVAYYDFVPYSLSNPIMFLGCGHSPIGSRDLGADRIAEEEAVPAFIGQRALAALTPESAP